MGDDPEALGSMQLTVFLQIRQTRNGSVELTRRVQLPVAEGLAALRKAVQAARHKVQRAKLQGARSSFPCIRSCA